MIRVLDDDFNILDTIPKYISIKHVSRFTESGSFSLVLPIGRKYENIKRGNIILHDGKYGIIEYIKQTESELTVSGYDLKAIALYRIADVKDYSGKAETVIKSILSDNTAGERSFKHLNIVSSQERGKDIVRNITELQTVENQLKLACEDAGIGYDITVSNKQMHFDVCIPETINIIYGMRFKNISSYEYTLDALQEKNTAVFQTPKISGFNFSKYDSAKSHVWLTSGTVYFKNGECYSENNDFEVSSIANETYKYVYAYCSVSGSSRGCAIRKAITQDTDEMLYVLIGTLSIEKSAPTAIIAPEAVQYTLFRSNETEPTGFARKETSAKIDDYADKLKTNRAAETAAAEILSGEDYRNKWKLGDYVTLRVDVLGERIAFTRQITEIEETYDAKGYHVTPAFGTQKDNILRKIIKGREMI